jgi:prepilin-type N-terminal cleavage/methylation domain-containing protein
MIFWNQTLHSSKGGPSPALWPASSCTRSRRKATAGFTLPEITITSAILVIIMGGVMALNIFSVRSASGVTRMLQINSQAHVLAVMAQDIRSAQSVSVNNSTGGSFVPIAWGTEQKGNALCLTVPEGGTNHTVYYHVDGNNQLWRQDATASVTEKYLTDVTNTVVFSLQDYKGKTISTQTPLCLVAINLQVADPNPQDFRQVLNLQTSIQKRN